MPSGTAPAGDTMRPSSDAASIRVRYIERGAAVVRDVAIEEYVRGTIISEFAPGAGHGLVAERDRASWSGWLAELAGELADPGRLGAREAVAGLLTRILVAAARLAPAAPSRPDPVVERVLDEIEATFREPVSAGDIARALGYTPGHLTTVVRKRTGRPLLEWITERRMLMLSSLSWPVTIHVP